LFDPENNSQVAAIVWANRCAKQANKIVPEKRESAAV
jgi:hypothetical protein